MPIPDVCVWGETVAGPGAPTGSDGGTPVGPGDNPADEHNTGPAEGPLSNYLPGSGTVTTGWPELMLTSYMRKTLYVKLLLNNCDQETPSDLSDVDHVRFIAKEWLQAPEQYMRKDCEIVDGPNGLLKISFEPDDLPFAGIWPSAFLCYNKDDEVIAHYNAYLYVRANYDMVGKTNKMLAPVTIHEVRLAMRDMCPEANTLLEDLEFSDEEIIYAIQRPIFEWNETPPDLGDSGYSFTQNTFPWHEHWLRGTMGYLLISASVSQARNQFDYSAGGISIKDKNKMPAYQRLGQQFLQEWREWILLKKKDINMTLCYGGVYSVSFGSPYPYPYNTWSF